MADEGVEQVAAQRWPGKVAPGLEGLYGRLRINVAGQPVGTLVVEGVCMSHWFRTYTARRTRP